MGFSLGKSTQEEHHEIKTKIQMKEKFIAYNSTLYNKPLNIYVKSDIIIHREIFQEFFRAFAQSAKMTIHIENKYGNNAHHIIESCFKVLAVCLRNSVDYVNFV